MGCEVSDSSASDFALAPSCFLLLKSGHTRSDGITVAGITSRKPVREYTVVAYITDRKTPKSREYISPRWVVIPATTAKITKEGI